MYIYFLESLNNIVYLTLLTLMENVRCMNQRRTQFSSHWNYSWERSGWWKAQIQLILWWHYISWFLFFWHFNLESLLLDDFDTAQLFLNRNRPRHHMLMPQSHLTDAAETKGHCPKSSTGRPSPAFPPNAGAPSSELSLDEKTMEKDEEEKVIRLTDSQQPLTTLTH